MKNLLYEKVEFNKMSPEEIQQYYSKEKPSEYRSRLKRALKTAEKNEILYQEKIQKLKSLLNRALSSSPIEKEKNPNYTDSSQRKEPKNFIKKPTNNKKSFPNENPNYTDVSQKRDFLKKPINIDKEKSEENSKRGLMGKISKFVGKFSSSAEDKMNKWIDKTKENLPSKNAKPKEVIDTYKKAGLSKDEMKARLNQKEKQAEDNNDEEKIQTIEKVKSWLDKFNDDNNISYEKKKSKEDFGLDKDIEKLMNKHSLHLKLFKSKIDGKEHYRINLNAGNKSTANEVSGKTREEVIEKMKQKLPNILNSYEKSYPNGYDPNSRHLINKGFSSISKKVRK